MTGEAAGYNRVLFLGNSITRHGPNPKIGWTGDWGMAASAPEKDFVHLVTTGLTASSGNAPETLVKNIATFERAYDTFDLEVGLKDAFDFGADLVIVAIGENVPALKSADEKARFAARMKKLLRRLQAKGHPRIVVRSCFWPNAAKDEALAEASRDAGGEFVDIGDLGRDESNKASAERDFEHKGVAAHPGDKGMRGIADAILKTVRGKSRSTTRK